MFPGLFSAQRYDPSVAAEGFPLLGFSAISEDAGGENLFEEAYACKGEGFVAQLPMRIYLESGHVWYHQFRPNNLPQWNPRPRNKRMTFHNVSDYDSKFEGKIRAKVLSMSKLGGASSRAQFVVDIPLQLIEVKSSRTKTSSGEQRTARLMEDDISRVYFHWERSTIKAPELEAPL